MTMSWLLVTQPAFGATNCRSGPNQLFFAGWWSSGGPLVGHEPEGAKASLTYEYSDACLAVGSRDPSRWAWVMIQTSGAGNFYAQAGYWNGGGPLDCWQHFTEWNNNAGPHHVNGACVSGVQTHTPKVAYVPATGATQMWIDTTLFSTMNICTCTWARPLVVDYLGETHDTGTDVPGYPNTKTDWNTMQIQYFTDNTWHGTCGTITLRRSVTFNGYDADAVACNHVRSWTK
jgi:hypothetical protein